MFEINNDNDFRLRYLTFEQMNLINAFRTMNINSAIYVKFMIDCMVYDSACLDTAYTRLLRIPDEAFKIFSHYYGESDAGQLYNLMMQDIILMKRLAEALMEKEEEVANQTMQQWKDNIISISGIYAKLNPYWSREQWESLLTNNLQLTYQEIIASIGDDCVRGLEIFDRIKAQAIIIGDYQARGIIRGLTLPDMLI